MHAFALQVEAHVLTLETKIEELQEKLAEASKESKLLKLKMLAPKFNKSAMGSSMQQAPREASRRRRVERQVAREEPKPRQELAAEEGQYGRDGLQQAVIVDEGERRRRRPGRAAGGGDARGG